MNRKLLIIPRIDFDDLILYIVCFINLFPSIKNIVGNYFLFGLIVLWIAFCYRKRYVSPWEALLFCWTILGILICCLAGITTVAKIYIADLVNLVFPYLVFLKNRINKEKCKNNAKVLLIIASLSSIYGTLDTFLLSKTKLFYRSSESYALTYISVLVAIVLLNYIITEKKATHFIKVCTILTLLIITFGIYNSGFFVAILTYIVAIIFYFIFRNNVIDINKIAIMLISLMVGLAIFFNLYEILTFIASKISNHYYITKINDMLSMFNGSAQQNTVSARLDVYYKSLYAIRNHPLIGNIWQIQNDSIAGVAGMISYHSTILDNFALFGLGLGTFPFALILGPLVSLNKNSYENNNLMKSILVAMFLILLADNMIPGMGVIAYLICPALMESLEGDQL